MCQMKLISRFALMCLGKYLLLGDLYSRDVTAPACFQGNCCDGGRVVSRILIHSVLLGKGFCPLCQINKPLRLLLFLVID